MRLPFKLEVLSAWWSLGRSRRSFERDPERHQRAMWLRFQQRVLTKAPLYRDRLSEPLSKFSIQQKAEFMRDFNQINTCGLSLSDAMDVAVKSEESRDFKPTISGITVGLSSGTSGNRGLFLASDQERAVWVAAVLQRILGWSFRKRRIAFFLRANNNLYSSVQSRFISFKFFDLLEPLADNLRNIGRMKPDVVVGQPSLLIRLADAQIQSVIDIAPSKIISVAEVLSKEDENHIQATFGIDVDQVYQCTEGLFGQTCAHGTIHLNEDWLIIEKEWIDDTRFVPIITDLRRESQPVLRYRMNDILHAGSCKCGSKMQAISQIEGRMDDVLILGEDITLFPDFIRRAVVGAHPDLVDYQVVQISRHELSLYLSHQAHWRLASEALQKMLLRHGLTDIIITYTNSKIHSHGSKLRRIIALRT
jgi:putative adenylate-forming enzyme